ncbi:carboxymuconolactone decarboxylase family protein [Dyadobacter subterraneus]|uniref:Carboxymuconolactone decarboxylase family protein n=1 Tax=Dyadobacter subterraneus TaxID=2773304 RepID=A0ABR9WEG6_9BACT|nr:carboxymuconolactone decarboxylase family protein [Dyadobacter subterraneus]MBE9463880.1 carboxymuconolactone decarboxylase family protein [Dyadobacter subterraneus]
MSQAKPFSCALLLVLMFAVTVTKAQTSMDQKKELNLQQQSIVAISALTASGDLENLSKQLDTGLDAGLNVEQVKEILVQLYAYCGFPRSLNGISALMAVTEKRKGERYYR